MHLLITDVGFEPVRMRRRRIQLNIFNEGHPLATFWFSSKIGRPKSLLNSWDSLFLVHLYAYFQQLFQYFLHLSRPYIKTRQENLPLKFFACSSCQWNLQVKVVGSLLFYRINWWWERVKWVAQSEHKHLTGEGLTYQNALHMHISTRLNFG